MKSRLVHCFLIFKILCCSILFVCMQKIKTQEYKQSLLNSLAKIHWQETPFQDFMNFFKRHFQQTLSVVGGCSICLDRILSKLFH